MIYYRKNGKDTKKTNREKLNEMSNEELAHFIYNKESVCEMCSNSYYNDAYDRYICKDLRKNCGECVKEWLESEVEND